MEQPFEIVFAGPAAGTVASAHFGKLIDRGDLLCVDIGGTSCDISMVSKGEPYVNTTFLLEHDLIVNALSNEVESIGAGGGSLVTISPSGEVLVGPGSAGADPGPACYGKGGTQPATTDTLILMGIIDPKTFAGGRMSLDPSKSQEAFENLDTTLSLHNRVNYAFNIGINNVAEGITNIAIKHGIDPRDYSLVAFGAAGPMLLPACMDLVHAREVIVPPHPGLFSALGLVSSDQVYGDSRSSYVMLGAEAAESINKIYSQMEEKLRERFDDSAHNVQFVRSMDARLAGQTWETPFVSVPSGEITEDKVTEMIETFHQVYESRAGNRFDGLPVQAVTYRVEAVIKVDKVDYPVLEKGDGAVLAPDSTFELRYLTDEPVTAGRYQRETFKAGDRIEGPAVIHEALSTTFMLPGQVAVVGEYGELRITRA
jgi:N-methylhydantoinase A